MGDIIPDGIIDLHVHTSASDGSMTPSEVAQLASKSGVIAIAVTDHDTIEGVTQALLAGKNYNIEVIPGIEISVQSIGETHILGYFLPEYWEYSMSSISKTLITLQERRFARNEIVISKLNKAGINIDLNDVLNEAGGNVLSRLHVAAAIVKKGYENDISAVFKKHIGKGCHAYEPKEILTAKEGIELINNSKGIAVLAHPYSTGFIGDGLKSMISTLKEDGLQGIEAIYWDYSDTQTDFLIGCAKEADLLITAGSDFHGLNRSDSMIGIGKGNLNAGYKYLKILKDRISLCHSEPFWH